MSETDEITPRIEFKKKIRKCIRKRQTSTDDDDESNENQESSVRFVININIIYCFNNVQVIFLKMYKSNRIYLF